MAQRYNTRMKCKRTKKQRLASKIQGATYFSNNNRYCDDFRRATYATKGTFWAFFFHPFYHLHPSPLLRF